MISSENGSWKGGRFDSSMRRMARERLQWGRDENDSIVGGRVYV